MKYFKNIEQALKELRPTDKINKVLSNKFALVECEFINGEYSKPTLLMLHDNNVVNVHYNKNRIKNELTFNKDRILKFYYKDKVYRSVNTNNKKTVKFYRQVYKVLNNL